jgi:hypothetical protein
VIQFIYLWYTAEENACALGVEEKGAVEPFFSKPRTSPLGPLAGLWGVSVILMKELDKQMYSHLVTVSFECHRRLY